MQAILPFSLSFRKTSDVQSHHTCCSYGKRVAKPTRLFNLGRLCDVAEGPREIYGLFSQKTSRRKKKKQPDERTYVYPRPYIIVFNVYPRGFFLFFHEKHIIRSADRPPIRYYYSLVYDSHASKYSKKKKNYHTKLKKKSRPKCSCGRVTPLARDRFGSVFDMRPDGTTI